MLITQECTLRLYLRAYFDIRNTCYDGMRCAKSSVRMNVMVICLCTYLSVNLHPTVVCSCRVQSEGCTLWQYVRAQSIVQNARYGTEYLRAHSNVKMHVTVGGPCTNQCEGARYEWQISARSSMWDARYDDVNTSCLRPGTRGWLHSFTLCKVSCND